MAETRVGPSRLSAGKKKGSMGSSTSAGAAFHPAGQLTEPSSPATCSEGKPTTTTTTTTPSKLVFGLSARTNRLKHDEYAERRRLLDPTETATLKESPIATSSTTLARLDNSPETVVVDAGRTARRKEGTKQVKKIEPSSPSRDSNEKELVGHQCERKSRKETMAKNAEPNRAKAMEGELGKSHSDIKSRSVIVKPEVATKRKSASSNENQQPQHNLQEQQLRPGDNSTTTTTTIELKAEPEVLQPVRKMQFTVPPPPPMKSSRSLSGGSVVSYAKSRIYDRKSKISPPTESLSDIQAVAGGGRRSDFGWLAASGSLACDTPTSGVLSGFKPPKQQVVSVSKARERWEGGEPFSKCKSRQRLAAAQQAQRGRVLLQSVGGLSLSSVAAARQQLHLNQSMASSSSYLGSTLLGSSPSSGGQLKVLTRGSVLERVQQFERVPDPPLLAAENGTELYIDEQITFSGTKEASSSSPERSQSPVSKQALYKSRVSSIQHSQQISSPPASPEVGTPTPPSSICSSGSTSPPSPILGPASPLAGSKFNQSPPGRLSFRRRSSIGQSAPHPSYSIIPRFYQPKAGSKPNTYELELQKKNIEACFDKLPEGKASLVAGPTCRRHFQAVANACGFPDYLKEPLFRFVQHHLSGSGFSPTGRPSLRRKQSVASLMNQLPNLRSSRSLSRAASLEGSARSPVAPVANSEPDTSTSPSTEVASHVDCDQFLTCWVALMADSPGPDLAAKFLHLLTLGDPRRQHLVAEDFVALVQSVIDDHPGLKFLRAAPDFHMRYIQTVIARIYFCVNKSWTGKISLTELRHSNLLAVLQVLGQEEDINQITDYFSYEHFYVIYCKFWSLDQDHDLLLSKEDLARHNEAAISSRIIDRIFAGILSRQIQQTGKMSYSDFVWFLIAEEDKKHPRSIEYWFRLMDLDGDGYISLYEMEYFYYEQMKRLELMNIEALPFQDSVCQIFDLVNPHETNKISLADLKRAKMATIFFDTFINLEKYLEHESREFVSTRDIVQDGTVISDWDRYASEEYEALVTEESAV